MVDYYDGNPHSTRVIPDRDSQLPKVAETAYAFSKCTSSRLIVLGSENLFASTFVFIYVLVDQVT